jgi:hypothetical protein
MPTNELATVQKDDSLMLLREYGNRGAFPVTVVKAGPVWLHVVKDGGHGVVEKYRRDDRTNGSGFSQHGMIYTLPEWEAMEREAAARKYLHAQGVDLKLSSAWNHRTAELADLIRAYEDGRVKIEATEPKQEP